MRPRPSPILIASVATVWLNAVPAWAADEIAYDDGTAERGIVWSEPRNGVAVRFSVEPGTSLLGARVYVATAPFWNPMGICVLDASGADAAPGDTLCTYFEAALQTWHGFQEVTFPAPIALVDSDFYVVYLQTRGASGDSDVIGIDTSSPPDGRSWLYQNGAWSHRAPEAGDVMIRALVVPPVATAADTWARIKLLYRD